MSFLARCHFREWFRAEFQEVAPHIDGDFHFLHIVLFFAVVSIHKAIAGEPNTAPACEMRGPFLFPLLDVQFPIIAKVNVRLAVWVRHGC